MDKQIIGSFFWMTVFISFFQFLPEDKTAVTPYIDKSQLYWLNQQLNESENDIEIVFMHIPFTTKNIEQKTANELYTALAENPTYKLIVAGHHHKNIIKKIPIEAANEIVQVQTDALVEDPKNWRLIRLTENNILVSVPGDTENELVIDLSLQVVIDGKQ